MADEKGKNSEVGYCRPPKEHQFKPGQVTNPNGRRGCFKDILNRILDETSGDITKREVIARLVYEQAEGGNLKAIKELLDRVEGKPVQEVKLESGPIKLYGVDAPIADV